MTLTQKIVGILPKKEHLWISFVDGGGKTSLIKALAKEFKSQGKSVLITTTTRIQNKLSFKWDEDVFFSDEASVLGHVDIKPEIVLYGESSYDIKKLVSPRLEILKILYGRFDVVLCESDGSRQLPLKIHSDRDPVIVDWNDYSVCVAGAWSAGDKRSNQTFHCDDPALIDEEFIEYLINSEEGFFKKTEVGKRCVVINGTDICTEQQTNMFVNRQWPSDCVIIAGSVLKNELFNEN